MSKITYANKQTAVDPNNPAPNEIFYATDANEVKASVNDLYDRLDNITLIDGFVSGPTLIATSSTDVAVQTFTQNVALIYNANNFQYTRNAGAADLTFTATPDATFDKGCIIQANGTTISLKQGVAAANVIYPTPDTSYVQIYSFIISTTGISSIIDSLGSYLELNNLNSGNVVIDGYYKQDDIISKVLKTASDGTFIGIDGTSAQYIKGDGSLGTLASDFVTSVGLTMPSAFQVSGSPITTSGTIAVQGAGNSTQYIAGDGTLVTFPVAGQAGTLVTEVRNVSGATMTKGTVVYINGANGNKPTIAKARANSESTSARTFGLLQTDIANNSNGYCVVVGNLIGLDTSSFTEGIQLYLSGLTAGGYTSTKALAPTHLVYIGKVTRSHPTQGQIEVGIQNGYELDEIHDVAISSPLQGHSIFWNSALSLWVNSSIATALGYTPIGGSGTSNYIAKFNGSTTTIGNSLIYDNGTNIGIGTTSPAAKLQVIANMAGWAGWIENQEATGTGSGLVITGGTNAGGISLLVRKQDGTSTFAVNGNGNVGIGTTAPHGKLEVSNGTQSLVFDPNTAYNGPYIQCYNYASSAYLPLDYISYSHHFNTSGTEKMRISNAGAISMGTTGSYGGRLTMIPSSNPTSASDSKNQISIGEASSNNSYNLKIGYINLGANYYGSLQVISGGVASNLLLNADGGNVGIGTTSPAAKLEVYQSSTSSSNYIYTTLSGSANFAGVMVRYAGVDYMGSIGNPATGEYRIGGFQTGYFQTIYTNGTEKLRVTTSGSVGIGTTSPTSKLHVVDLPSYADNTTALSGGLTAGAFYHTAGVLKVVI